MREQVMPQQHWLRALQMCAPREWVVDVARGLLHERIDHMTHKAGDAHGMIFGVHAHKSGDLVVAGASGSKLAAKFWPSDLDQSAFEGRMHVFVLRLRDKCA